MLKISLILHWFCFLYVIKGQSEFTVFFSPNGGNKDYPFQVTINDIKDGWTAFFMRLKVEIPTVIEPLSHSENWQEFSIWNRNGTTLQSTNELVDYEGKNLYVVPKNRYFIWPHVRTGHRATINDVEGANGPIFLDSLHSEPRLFYIHNLFSAEEAEILIQRALTIKDGPNALLRSTTGTTPREERDMEEEARSTGIRTSDNAWDQNSPTSNAIVKRIFSLLRVPYAETQKDGLQLVRYRLRNAYREHHDYFPQSGTGGINFDPASGGANRFATVFLYLTDVEEGGQTVFPYANTLSDETLDGLDSSVGSLLKSHKRKEHIQPILEDIFQSNSWEKNMAKKCYNRFSVKPKLGSAVMFYSMNPNWKMDQNSLHGGCPVLNGTKWGANIWVWSGPRYDKIANPAKIDKPDSDLQVHFKNKFSKTGNLYWEKMLLITLAPDESSAHNTYAGHTFRFEIDGMPVWSHTMDKTGGVNQQWLIDPQEEHQEL